jgi:hypothetical protein
MTSGDTQLGDQPVPLLEEINSQGEFRGIEIDAATFEALWRQHVRHPSGQIGRPGPPSRYQTSGTVRSASATTLGAMILDGLLWRH